MGRMMDELLDRYYSQHYDISINKAKYLQMEDEIAELKKENRKLRESLQKYELPGL